MSAVVPSKAPPKTDGPSQTPHSDQSPAVVRFEVPSLAKGMKDVYKVGGWPLAALLVVALIALALVGQGLFAQAASLIKTISLFVAISSVVSAPRSHGARVPTLED